MQRAKKRSQIDLLSVFLLKFLFHRIAFCTISQIASFLALLIVYILFLGQNKIWQHAGSDGVSRVAWYIFHYSEGFLIKEKLVTSRFRNTDMCTSMHIYIHVCSKPVSLKRVILKYLNQAHGYLLIKRGKLILNDAHLMLGSRRGCGIHITSVFLYPSQTSM